MPNMSYCMFENTFNDLEECYNKLGEEYNSDLNKLSPSERKFAIKLIKSTHDFFIEFEDLIEPE